MVLDAAGVPIAGAVVQGHASVVTDNDGRATVAWNQGDGVACVTASAPGRAVEAAMCRGQAPGGLRLTLRLRALVRVTGVVHDDAGGAVARATVRTDDESSLGSTGEGVTAYTLGASDVARTRSDGSFSIVVPEGVARLFAAKIGYCASGVTVIQAPARSVALVVSRTFTMAAELVDERGVPVRGVVRVDHEHPDIHPADELPREWSDLPDLVTRNVRPRDGRIRVAGIRPGTTLVRVEHPSSRRATIQVEGSPGDLIDVGVVTLQPTREVCDVTRLPRRGRS